MKQVRNRWARLSDLWCAMMHHDTTWPINGYYRCRKCKRVYLVPWEEF
jgi:hypothetical protein